MKLAITLVLLFPIFAHAQSLDDLTALPKPTPKYQKSVAWCAKDGDGSDRELNTVKNRIDLPKDRTVYFEMKFETIFGLQAVAGTTGTRNRKKKDLSSIDKYEGRAVMLGGYLKYTKDTSSNKMVGGIQEGEEACNCHRNEFEHVDYHLWLVKDPKDTLDKAIVVEMTPRMRAVHKGRWINEQKLESDLNFLATQKIPVRIYGWLMFDGEHVGQLPGHAKAGKERRGTLWEIHPITKIDSFQNGKWDEGNVKSL